MLFFIIKIEILIKGPFTILVSFLYGVWQLEAEFMYTLDTKPNKKLSCNFQSRSSYEMPAQKCKYEENISNIIQVYQLNWIENSCKMMLTAKNDP